MFRKFAWENRNFLPGSTTPQISNQIDAAGYTSKLWRDLVSTTLVKTRGGLSSALSTLDSPYRAGLAQGSQAATVQA